MRRAVDRARFGVEAGDLARRQFRWAEAASAYRGYLERRPRDAAITVRLAAVLDASGSRREAMAVLQAALAVQPRSPALLRAYGALVQVAPPESDWSQARLSPRPAPPFAVVGEARFEILRATADVLLHDDAEAWLAYALDSTGAVAAYADHELRPEKPRESWSAVLQGAPHPLDMATMSAPPVVAAFRPGFAPLTNMPLRDALLAALSKGPVAHVPLVLAEVSDGQSHFAAPTFTVDPDVKPLRILVVVPTRDRGDVLEVMVDSLVSKAARPDALSIVVVDNGSRDPETLRRLQEWSAEGRIRNLRIDEPFNWSDLNNRAVIGHEADAFLFINNDVEMLTEGWDLRVFSHLSRPDAGVVGARLIYPAGNLQHAGMALGAQPHTTASPGPLHEGLGAQGDDEGPESRWRRVRPAAAVTGAFLAVSRTVFEDAGGFDATTFPVGANDVDFCLRVRSLGRMIVYDGGIELRHHESLSRGHDDDPEGQGRAEQERQALRRIWGGDAVFDPSRNPAWVPDGVLLFAGYRVPDPAAVLAWIERSVDAWRARRA